MTRLAVLFTSAAILLNAIPYGSAGPACAKKYYQQAECMQLCKSKWGYPGMMMGSGPWGDVIQSAEVNNWESMIASACGVAASSTTSASTTTATATPAGAVGMSSDLSSAVSTTQMTSSSVTSVSSSISVSIAPSSSIALTTTSAPPPPESTTSSTEEQPSSTSTPVVATTQPAPSTSTSAPPPPATTQVAQAQSSSSSSSSDANSGSGSNGSSASDSDVQEYLADHNSVRSQHGASALTWNNTLAAAAQTWANGCVFQHSGGKLGPFGENLAAGTGSGYGIDQAIQSWANEASQYNPSDPVASHFTQMVWKDTTQVGCAEATQCTTIFASSFGSEQYFVCEYFPQGNVIGAFAQNVQA